jgi:hypothetical protein
VAQVEQVEQEAVALVLHQVLVEVVPLILVVVVAGVDSRILETFLALVVQVT